MSNDTFEGMQERAIFTQRVVAILRQRFPGSTLNEEGTLRDLCDAAFDIVQEDKKSAP